MSPLEFIIFFMLLTIVSSIFIVSFYEITRHYITIHPDGKETIDGYLLKRWSWYWEYVSKTGSSFYFGEPLEYKLKELKKMLPSIGDMFYVSQTAKSFWVLKDNEIITDDIVEKIEAVLMVRMKVGGHKNEFYLLLDYPIYLFPSWIRKPFSSCVRCMASFYGSIIWLLVNYMYSPFGWTNHKIFAFLFFWCIFVCVLTKTNELIYKKTYV